MNRAFKKPKLTNKQLTTWAKFKKRQYLLNALLTKFSKEL